MHLVEDEDAGARLHRAESHRLDDLAHRIDAGVGGGIHLRHIGMTVGENGHAIRAHAAGLNRRAARAIDTGAVQRAGNDARRGGFAHTAHAGEHEGVGDSTEGERIAQRAHHRLLPDQIGEIRRPVFAGEHAVGQSRAGSCDGCRRGSARQHIAEQAGAFRDRDWRFRLFISEKTRHAIPGWNRVGGRTATRTRTRCGCYLPVLTGLARSTSAADLPRLISREGAQTASVAFAGHGCPPHVCMAGSRPTSQECP